MKFPSIGAALHAASNPNASHPMTKKRIIKNVVVLSIGVLVLFTAFDGLTMLQSTMNSEQGIGVISQAVIYICFCVSALIFPKYVIKKHGSKLTLVLSMLTYVPYVASNFYPHWSVMMPTSILIGLGAALLWGSQANYLNDVSVFYAELLLSDSIENRNDDGTEMEEGELCAINKHSIDGRVYSVYGSLACKLQNQEKNDGARILTSPQESASSLQDDVPVVGDPWSSSKGQYSFGCESEGQCPNLKQINIIDNDPNEEDFISKADTEIEEPFTYSGSIADDKDFELNQKYSISIPNDSTSNCYSNIITDDIDVEPNIAIPELNRKDLVPVLRCFDSGETRDKNIDPNRKKSAIEAVANHRGKLIESTTARFFGFHGMVFHSSMVWSNLLSYYIMQGSENVHGPIGNHSCACGAGFCDSADPCFQQHAGQTTSDTTRYVLTGVCVCLGLASVLVVSLFLDPLDDKTKEEDGDEGFSLRLLTATLRLAKRFELVLLMPMSLHLGMVQGFFIGDMTKSFIGCAWGAHNVGLVAALYGVACALSSLLSGWLVRRVGRAPIFAAAALLNVSSCALLLTWTPNADAPLLFFVEGGMWGMFVGTVWSQLRAFYGVLFKADEEAAFATFHTWYSLGFFVSFAYSSFICTFIKIYLLLAVSTFGFIGYFTVERLHSNDKLQLRTQGPISE